MHPHPFATRCCLWRVSFPLRGRRRRPVPDHGHLANCSRSWLHGRSADAARRFTSERTLLSQQWQCISRMPSAGQTSLQHHPRRYRCQEVKYEKDAVHVYNKMLYEKPLLLHQPQADPEGRRGSPRRSSDDGVDSSAECNAGVIPRYPGQFSEGHNAVSVALPSFG